MFQFNEDKQIKSEHNVNQDEDKQIGSTQGGTDSGPSIKRSNTITLDVIKGKDLKEDDLKPQYQIDPFKDANVILPEMKKNLAIFINRSSFVNA